MTPSTTHGHIRSALGEHFIVLLIVAIAILGALTTLPALKAQTEGTASRMQERVDLPRVVASDLESTP